MVSFRLFRSRDKFDVTNLKFYNEAHWTISLYNNFSFKMFFWRDIFHILEQCELWRLISLRWKCCGSLLLFNLNISRQMVLASLCLSLFFQSAKKSVAPSNAAEMKTDPRTALRWFFNNLIKTESHFLSHFEIYARKSK